MEPVKTIKSDMQPRNRCIRRAGVYFLIDRDIFKISDKWYTADAVIVDSYTGNEIPIDKSSSLREAKNINGEIVRTSKTMFLLEFTDRVKMEFGDLNHQNNSLFFIRTVCASAKDKVISANSVAQAWGIPNTFKNEQLYLHPEVYVWLTKSRFRPVRRDGADRIYNSAQSPSWAKLCSLKLHSSNKFDSLAPVLGKNRYGFEIETSDGNLPTEFYENNGFIKLYDGSISGHELVSVPFALNNFELLENMCELLKNTHYTDSNCSIHIHIGDIPFSERNLVCMYLLFQRLDKEIHQLAAPFKKEIAFFHQNRKTKDHCKSLHCLIGSDRRFDDTTHEEVYVKDLANQIYRLHFGEISLSQRQYRTADADEYLEKVNKWNLHGRYYFVNFLNYCVKTRGTVELRLLQGTFNFNRILNWLLINMSVIKYALENQSKILAGKDKIYLTDCITFAYEDNIKDTLLSFVEEMKDNFTEAQASHNLQISSEYFNNDKIKSTIKF